MTKSTTIAGPQLPGDATRPYLVLSRKIGQSTQIGDQLQVQRTDDGDWLIEAGQVRLELPGPGLARAGICIQAPREIRIIRSEAIQKDPPALSRRAS